MMKATRKLLVLGAVLLGMGMLAAPQAQAGWWHGYGYGYYGWGYSGYSCCSPCWTPVCAPVCSVSVCDPYCGGWYLGVRPGPIRRALFGPYRWYRSYGCCSFCYSDPCCCYDTCCVSSAVSVVDAAPQVQSTQKPTLAPRQEPAAPAAGTPNEPTFAPAPAPVPAPAPAVGPAPAPKFEPEAPSAAPAPAIDWAPQPASPSNDPFSLPAPAESQPAPTPAQPQTTTTPAGEGTLSILVPEGARVVINGYVTKSTGRVRRYVAQNLKPGLVYPFDIQVSVVRDGETLSDSRQIRLTGGSLEAVVFNFDKTSVDHIARAW